MGVWSLQNNSRVILVSQKILNETFNFIASVFQNCHKIHFLLHFHFCCFSIDRREQINFFLWCIYILSFKTKNNLDSVKSPIVFFCFSLVLIIKTENVSLQYETESWKQILLMCFVKKGVLENG